MATNLSAARRKVVDSDIANGATRRGKYYGKFRNQRQKHDPSNKTTYRCREFTLGNPTNGGDAAICHLFTPGIEVQKVQAGQDAGKYKVKAIGTYLYGFNKDGSGNRYEMAVAPKFTFFLIFGKSKNGGSIDFGQQQEKKAFISELATSTGRRAKIPGQGFVAPIAGYVPIGIRYDITRDYRTTTAPLSVRRGLRKSRSSASKGGRK